jgi:hypothetical protein
MVVARENGVQVSEMAPGAGSRVTPKLKIDIEGYPRLDGKVGKPGSDVPGSKVTTFMDTGFVATMV